MNRHAVVTLVVVAACGGKQAPPGGGVALDAAPAPVVVAPPEPPADIVALRAEIAATRDEPRLVILHGQLAAAEWATRCDAPIDGLCFQMVARSAKAPPTCDGHTEDVEVTPRPTVGEVQKLIGELRQRWGDGASLDESADPAAQAEAVATSLLILGNIEAEALLAVPRLAGLDFDPSHGSMAEKSAKKLQAWFLSIQERGRAAIELYGLVAFDPVLRRWSPAQVIEAVARTAMVQDWVASAIRGLDIPKSIAKDPELVGAYCDALTEHAEPVEAAAAESWSACASAAEQLALTGGWVDRCHAEQPPRP